EIIDSIRGQLPVFHGRHIRNSLFESPLNWHAKQAGLIEFLIVQNLAIERFAAPPAAVMSYLDFFRGAVGRYLPHLLTSSSIGSEIDPLAVSRPIRAGIDGRVCGHPPRRAALRIHHVDV